MDSVASVVVAVAAASMAVMYAVRSPHGTTARLERPEYLTEWRALSADGLVIGRRDAPVQVVEFVDFECPYCARFHNVLRATMARYGSRVAVALRHMPIRGHESALPAASAVDCAADQGRLDGMVSAVFEKRDSLQTKAWVDFARDAGVPDLTKFVSCMRASSTSPRLARDTAAAREIGVYATPTVIVNGWRFPTAPDSTALWAAMDSLLANRKPFARKRVLGVF
jgi:protein-disulfide isomerase